VLLVTTVPSGHRASPWPSFPPATKRPPARSPPGTRPQSRAGRSTGSRDRLQLAQPQPQGTPGAGWHPGEAGGMPGCATCLPQTGPAGPASPRATLRVPVASPKRAWCHYQVQDAGLGEGCPVAGHGFAAGTMRPGVPSVPSRCRPVTWGGMARAMPRGAAWHTEGTPLGGGSAA